MDAALWFVVAVDDFLREAADTGFAVSEGRGWPRPSRRSSTDTWAGLVTGLASPWTVCYVLASLACSDAILDRVIHRAHRLELKGPSMRKQHDAEVSATAPA